MTDVTDDTLARLDTAVGARTNDIVDLASELIRRDTTARNPDDPPREERDLQELVGERLRGAGADVEIWEPDPTDIAPWSRQIGADRLDFTGRPQLTARFAGEASGRSLVLNGHIDAVSAEPIARWSSHPFEPQVADGRLAGRGACDMKGGVAAMVVAAETVARELGPMAGDLIVNTVTDEESSGAGALASIARGLSADAVIVPEPTSLDVWVACRGSLTPTITVEGRPGHAELAQPHWRAGGAVNAIEKLEVVLAAVRALREEWRTRPDQEHQHLSPGTIVPTLVEGGEWFVTYPARARITCELMYLPGNADEDGGATAVADEVADWIHRAAAADPWLAENPPRIDDWGSTIPPAEIPAEHPLAELMHESALTFSSNSRITGLDSWYDGASFVRYGGAPAVAFGPRSIETAHVVDESVPISDLVDCARAIARAAVMWCA